MAKILINEKQYSVLINYLHENKEILSDKTILEEGMKDWILGAALILNTAMGNNSFASGHNKVVADKAVASTQAMGQIKSALEDSTKLKQLTDAFEKLGLPNPTTTLAKNADKFVSKYNEISKNKKMNYHLDYSVVDNLQSLDTKLQQGYALKNDNTSVDTIKQANVKVVVKDTMDINFNANNFFVSGGFELSPEGIDSIRMAIEEIQKNGGKIINVNITSSTDAETINRNNPKISSFITDHDPSGNIELAAQRTNSVKSILIPLLKDVNISRNEIPNNGADVVSSEEFKNAKTPEERAALEAKSSKFRFVNLKITAVFSNTTEVESAPQLMQQYRFKLVKIITDVAASKNIKATPSFKMKKYSCKKPKHAGSFDCYTH